MKSFEFAIPNYEIKRQGNTLFIWEVDHLGDRVNIRPLEITVEDMHNIIHESNQLYTYHHPSCNAVETARLRLERARTPRTIGGEGESFDLALRAYMDISSRHRDNTSCDVLH